jgi:nicotinamidase/pyrazinamidase
MSAWMPKHRLILLIIDPQIDFHPGGSLGVPGANEDSERIASFIRRHMGSIEEIYVTLDSHHKLHIAHGAYWTNSHGEIPSPFTIISREDIDRGIWRPRDPHNLEHAKYYTQQLEAKGRFKLCIWPEHCLIGTTGHAVYPHLNAALQEWAGTNLKSIHYIHKGMCLGTEMYSAIAADVPLPSDPSTYLNHKLLDELNTADQLVVCGQALSHCVNFTVRDIVSHWHSDKSRILIMQDGSSPVAGFEEQATKFLEDMRAQGLTILRASNICS